MLYGISVILLRIDVILANGHQWRKLNLMLLYLLYFTIFRLNWLSGR